MRRAPSWILISCFGLGVGPGWACAPQDGGTARDAAAAPTDAAAAATDAAAAPTHAAAADASRAVTSGPPHHEATRAEAGQALARLEGWVRKGATDPSNAWAMAHGVVAFGKELRTAEGRPVVEVLVGDYVERKADAKGALRWSFPESSAAGLPVAPHRDLVTKTLVEGGVAPSAPFKTKDGQRVSLAEIVRDAEATFTFPKDDAGWRNYAWSAYAFLLASAKDKKLATAAGNVTLIELAERTMGRLEDEQRFLEDLLDQNAPERVEKRRQGIFSHHCGGLHLVQAAVLGASITQDPRLLARARRQLDIVLFRWEAERRIYAEALATQPKYRLPLLVQELKFFGHVLETFALARDYGVLPKDAEIERKLRMVTGDLALAVQQLEPAYTQPDLFAQLPAQTRYDLIGDGCHAIRGLRRGTVAFFAP